jgi:UDP-N-acetylglucosamine--N-acetylmuramyl-(pentapeptide) pyrophosphoryl-undecaprenol N-acetylglucosamine transferase
MADMIFTGGGTGGHLYPALAVADAVKAASPATRVLFVGTPDRIEARVVPEAGYPFEAIAARGLSRSPLQAAKALTLLAVAVWKALSLLRRERPRVVLGTGGYVSAPVLLAARLAGIPVVLQEQNVVPGKVNRWIARWARTVATSFPGSERYFPPRELQLVGNPIRTQAFERSPAAARAALGLPPDCRLLLVTGGSQGARRINEAVAGLIPQILAEPTWHVLHVAGPENVASLQPLADPRYHLVGYCEQMPDAILAADLVISRAGATTLAELTAVGRPMVLVPYPYAGGHQRLNAEAIVAAGAGLEIPDAELTPARLGEAILPLMQSPEKLQEMATASRQLGRPDAATALARMLLELAGPAAT